MTFRDVALAAEHVQKLCDLKPEIGIILGTGLSKLLEDVEVVKEIPYTNIPGFPLPTVEFHKGKFILGYIHKRPCVVLSGRYHYYEGYNMKQVTLPVRVIKLLGCTELYVSNAAGGINPNLRLSDLMLFSDHINMQPENPLRGSNMDQMGPRWPDMFQTYDLELLNKARKVAAELDLPVKEGVYASVQGPNLETPAEYRWLSRIGADAVGMSTVPEVIVARHVGLRVLAISVITDLCYPDALKPVDITEIMKAAANAEPHLCTLMKEVLK